MEILNRKAKYNYYITDTYEAGMVLKGTEIKAIRRGGIDLSDSYVIIKKGEAYVLNLYIAKYDAGNRYNHDERRTRKLLLNKAEIKKINNHIVLEGWTVIPLKLYFKRGKAKLLIGLAKGKKNYDKREIIKKRDLAREEARDFKYN